MQAADGSKNNSRNNLLSIFAATGITKNKNCMKRKNIGDENFSDIKNLNEHTFFPGEYTSCDLGLFYPTGFVP